MFFFCKQKTAYEMRISDWSSDVCSSDLCAVEGMHLRDGHDVLVADDAAAFADAVVRLHEDEALWTTLSRNGLDNVARHFSLDAARDTVRRVFFAPRG